MIPTFSRSSALLEARTQAHWAAQVVSALGTTLLPHQDDYSETNLGWDRARQGVVGREVRGVQAGLRIADPTWFVRGPRPAERTVAGSTLADGLRWLREIAVANGLEDRPLAPSTYELPGHPLGEGAAFQVVNGLDEIAAWFDVGSLALDRTAEREPGAGEVRCWPHHFDLATLIAVAADRTVGVGLSPGDDLIAEPYFYVSPHPRPEPGEGPEKLPAGEWNRSGWFGAVLRGTRIPSDDPRAAVDAFLDAAVATCRRMIATS